MKIFAISLFAAAALMSWPHFYCGQRRSGRPQAAPFHTVPAAVATKPAEPAPQPAATRRRRPNWRNPPPSH